MKKIFIATTLLATLLAGSAFAQTTDKPARCPNTVDILNVGFDGLYGADNYGWFAGKQNATYNTPEHWTFMMMVGTDKAKVMERVKRLLPQIEFTEPTEMKDGHWGCLLHGVDEEGNIYMAAATTPTVDLPAPGLFSN